MKAIDGVTRQFSAVFTKQVVYEHIGGNSNGRNRHQITHILGQQILFKVNENPGKAD